MRRVISEFSDNSQAVTVTLYNENVAERKTITFDNYVKFLLDHRAEQELFRLPSLPKGYYAGSLSPSDASTFKCTVVIPAAVNAMSFMGQNYIVPYPALLIKFCVTKGYQNSTVCYALDTDTPTDNSKLYQYPFGNVSTEGKVCWGSNTLPNLPSLHDVDKLVRIFYNSDSNSDYWGVNHHVKEWSKKDRTLGKFLTYLSKKEIFPKKLLVPKELTVGNII